MTRTKPTNPSYQSVREAVDAADAPERKGDANVDNGLAKVENAGTIAPRGVADVPIGRVLELAIERGTPTADLERLIAMYERMQANAAKQAFMVAKARFASNCPPIPRRTENSQFQVTRDGQKVNRKYAALEDISKTIRRPLAEQGLSFDWGNAVVNGNMVTVTCILSHEGGHSQSSSATRPIESKAGCSEQQKFSSAETYARRYSLIYVCGLTDCDEDDDGNAQPPSERITDDQAATIDHLIDEVKAKRDLFLGVFKVSSVSDIPASQFKRAIQLLEGKREKNKRESEGRPA